MNNQSDSPLTTARTKVNLASNIVQAMTEQVSNIADVVFGPQGPSAATANDHPPRSGEAGMLHDDIELLGGKLEGLVRQIDRLQILGQRATETEAAEVRQR